MSFSGWEPTLKSAPETLVDFISLHSYHDRLKFSAYRL